MHRHWPEHPSEAGLLGKNPLRIGRKTIIRVDVISTFMEINQGRDLLDCAQVQQVT